MPGAINESTRLVSGKSKKGRKQETETHKRYSSVPLESDVESGREGEPEPSSSVPPSSSTPTSPPPSSWQSCLDRVEAFFLVRKRRSSLMQEIRAGAVTFVTMAYIIVRQLQSETRIPVCRSSQPYVVVMW
jgi:hypothetical protein